MYGMISSAEKTEISDEFVGLVYSIAMCNQYKD
jgi:hypothetical protein